MTADAMNDLMLKREVATRCRVSESAVDRWFAVGCKARDGRRVTLARTKIAGRVYVAPGDLDAFLTAINAA